MQNEGNLASVSLAWKPPLILLHRHLCKHWQSLPSFFRFYFICICEGAKSFREVLDELIHVVSSLCLVQGGRRGRIREEPSFEELFYVSLEEMRLFGNFHCRATSSWGPGILKQWKMDDFQHGQGVFTLSVVSLFGPLLCQQGIRKGPNCPFNWGDGKLKILLFMHRGTPCLYLPAS